MATFDPTTNDENLPKLGSLAQAARSNQLKGARGILIAIGVLTLAVHAFVLFGAKVMVDAQFEKEVQELTKKGMVFDQAKLAELKDSAVRSTQLTAAGFMASGLLFVVMGLMVYRYPVPITVSALTIYLACVAIAGALNSESLVQGIIIKIIVISALAKAIKSAIAYQRERESPSTGLAG